MNRNFSFQQLPQKDVFCPKLCKVEFKVNVNFQNTPFGPKLLGCVEPKHSFCFQLLLQLQKVKGIARE